MKSKSKKYFRTKRKNNKKNKTKTNKTKTNKTKTNKKNKKGGDKCSSSMSDDFDIMKESLLSLKNVYENCCSRQKEKYFGTTKNKSLFCQKINQRIINKKLNESNTFNSSYDERPTSITEKSSSITERPTSTTERSSIESNDLISQQNSSPELDFSRLDDFEEKTKKEDEKKNR
jgi:hypothetical protein